MWNTASVVGINKDVVTGVCSILAKPVVVINRDNNHDLGYKVKLSIVIRGDMHLLTKLHRVFAQNGIYSTIKDVESKVRPRPILRIGRLEHIRNFQSTYLHDALDDDSPLYIGNEDNKDSWLRFLLILSRVEDKKHLTAKGLDEILKLKGVL
jgi:hypothetical protein